MQIIKGVAIAAVLIIAGLLALIVAAYLAFRIAAAIFEQQPTVQILRYMPLGRTGKCRTTKRGNNNAFGDREQQAA